MTHDGHVLDGTGIRVPFDPNGMNGGLVGVYFADSAYTIVYSYAARISPAFALLDTRPIAIAHADFNDEDSPYVATDGHEFIVVWSHRSWDGTDSLNLRRVQADGSAGETTVLVPGLVTARSVIWTGARYTIGYSRSHGMWKDDLFLTHVPARNDHPPTRDEIAISTTGYTRVADEPQYGGVSRVFMRDELSPRRRSVRTH